MTILGESTTTVATLEGLLSSVGPFVNLEACFINESPLAISTAERLLAGMNPNVFPESTCSCQLPPTTTAFLSRSSTNMIHGFVQIHKLLLAEVAGGLLLVSVSLHVFHKFCEDAVREGAVLHGAGVQETVRESVGHALKIPLLVALLLGRVIIVLLLFSLLK